MKQIKILGSGCKNCKTTFALVEKVVKEMVIEAEVTKVEDVMEIMNNGIMSTPAVIIDGVLVHSGGIPKESDIKNWLS